jgi:hypothetical protein
MVVSPAMMTELVSTLRDKVHARLQATGSASFSWLPSSFSR